MQLQMTVGGHDRRLTLDGLLMEGVGRQITMVRGRPVLTRRGWAWGGTRATVWG